jgi:3-dehydroquinate dehydratase-1
MKPTELLQVRGLTLGQGQPAICIPVLGRTPEEVLNSLDAALEAQPDVIEWRVDWLDAQEDPLALLAALRHKLPYTPLLVTFRSSNEGGKRALENDAYQSLLRQIAETGLADLIDVELMRGDDVVKQLVACAHASNSSVIGSNHDFHATPTQEEIVNRLERMGTLGCDIAKIAVMPQTPQDVLTLLQATQRMKQLHPELPLITMSMGQLGMVSRLCGEVFGSVLTFGSAQQASAPGQVEALQLRSILQLLHQGD